MRQLLGAGKKDNRLYDDGSGCAKLSSKIFCIDLHILHNFDIYFGRLGITAAFTATMVDEVIVADKVSYSRKG